MKLLRQSECPKEMIFGPCGGVRPDGTCEVIGGQQCAFLDAPLTRWPGPPSPGRSAAPGPAGGQPYVITDLHVRPRDLGSLRAVARRLKGTSDTVLVGDHGGSRNDFSPTFTAAAVLDEGVNPWVTLSCRDRNRVALAAECAGLAALGVTGVHCVTGDWQGMAGGDETKVFDLDALRLVDLARGLGLTVSVAAAPAAPPTGLRAARLAEKVRAGAQMCLVNHAGGPVPVARFVADVRELGADIPFVPCIPLLSDRASVAALASLPGLFLDPTAVGAADRGPEGDDGGIAAAVVEAAAMMAIDGVVGVNLSGSASRVSELDSAGLMAELARRIRPPREQVPA